MPFKNDSPQEILANAPKIAIVGISNKEHRDSYKVCRYLKEAGFELYPVNPMITEVMGLKVFPSLSDLPEKMDIIDVFRKPDAVPGIVQEAISIEADAIWLQEGVVHEKSAESARKAGLKVVMDLCIKKEHQKLS